MERDTSSDRGGDQAVWRDLVARLELPQAIEPADAPWPDRENLTTARHAGREDASRQDGSRQDGSRQGGSGQDSAGQDSAAKDSSAQASSGQDSTAQASTEQDSTGQDGSEHDEPGSVPDHDVPVSRRRVIRPATFLRYVEASQFGEGDAGRPGQPAGRHAVPPARLPREDPSRPRHDRNGRDDWQSQAGPPGDDSATRPGQPARPGHDRPGHDRRDGRGGLGAGLDFQDLADLEFFDEDEDERYVPPQIPPLPKLDPVARGAWTALFGGPGYLFLATTLSWQVPGWAELAAIVAFITGFVVLVSRLGDGPSRKDGPDQGAVV